MDNAFIIYGSDANLVCPDPNFYGGKVYLQTDIRKEFSFNPNAIPLGIEPMKMYEVPPTHSLLDESRGVGLLDLAFAIRNGRRPRCHYSMGLQTFEVVHGLIDSCQNGVNHKMISKTEKPKAVAPGIYRGLDQQVLFDD